MKDSPQTIFPTLKSHLLSFVPPLQVRIDIDSNFELAGTKEVIQGRKKVEGHYFANIVPKPKDVRLYFFPIYTHPASFPNLSPALTKCLKGKSCFHIKKLSPELEQEIYTMIKKGVEVYQYDELI